MSKRPTSPDSLSWSGSTPRVPHGAGNRGAIDTVSLGVASAGPPPSTTASRDTKPASAFTERPAVEVRRLEDEAERAIRPNGRVKLDRY